MAISDDYARVRCQDIIINRENRQRKTIDTKGLKDSIAARGVLQPIIVTRDLLLMAGERRLTASLELGLETIPCRFFEDLSQSEAMIVELEENLKRSDLSWQDTAVAIQRLHDLYLESDPTWTHTKTGQVLSLDHSGISRYLRVANDISNPNISKLPTLETAYNILKRADERRAGDALSEIMSTSHSVIPAAPAQVTEGGTFLEGEPPAPVAPASPFSSLPILHTAFAPFCSTFSSQPFNFIHCDFPYGVNVFDGAWGGVERTEHYSDTKDVYLELIEVLASNLDKISSHSCHFMFWFSMEHYEETFQLFRKLLPDVVWNKFPLIWTKSDNVGIVPDPKRGPRRVYETCLMGIRGDRPIVRPIANTYSCPTDKRYHPSTKPEPMLRHFMQMFVDNGTRMLDPTCGGGSALRAATTLGAESVLGLEMDETHYNNACAAYTSFLKLRSI